jgi:type IV fimbrial biogenesis protein FimT
MEIWRKTTMHDQYCKTRCHRQSGFTMVELMIVIVVIAILSAIAVPNIINSLPNYRLKAAARDMISNFQKAKMAAVKRNVTVVLDFVPASNRYEMFVDDGAGVSGNANNFTRDSGETLLGTIGMPNDVTLNSASFSGGTQKAGFNSRGLPASSRIGNVILLNNNSRYYKVTLSFAGNIKLEMSSDGTTWN